MFSAMSVSLTGAIHPWLLALVTLTQILNMSPATSSLFRGRMAGLHRLQNVTSCSADSSKGRDKYSTCNQASLSDLNLLRETAACRPPARRVDCSPLHLLAGRPGTRLTCLGEAVPIDYRDPWASDRVGRDRLCRKVDETHFFFLLCPNLNGEEPSLLSTRSVLLLKVSNRENVSMMNTPGGNSGSKEAEHKQC